MVKYQKFVAVCTLKPCKRSRKTQHLPSGGKKGDLKMGKKMVAGFVAAVAIVALLTWQFNMERLVCFSLFVVAVPLVVSGKMLDSNLMMGTSAVCFFVAAGMSGWMSDLDPIVEVLSFGEICMSVLLGSVIALFAHRALSKLGYELFGQSVQYLDYYEDELDDYFDQLVDDEEDFDSPYDAQGRGQVLDFAPRHSVPLVDLRRK